MPWKPQHTLDTREKILSSAAKLFTHRGYDGVGIDEIMSDVGLTRGVFYMYFSSKSDLYCDALLKAAQHSRNQLLLHCKGDDGLLEQVEQYLSVEHREGKHAYCPLAYLVTDIAHQDEKVRDTYTQIFQKFVMQIQNQGNGAVNHRKAIQSAIMMIGGLAVSRALNDDELAKEVLVSCQKQLDTKDDLVEYRE
ncbi:TetR/AcrR family transcriptional regulator [Vibrio aquimaris]|uniref:Putative HTH-type transcriptional regulator YvdT n=1 Tax=Vibrio aquimaris TaxID=2587862 RepID=A0A5P9CLJ0_9VIBR|nr:TetR/AcrR family transcriptional regulator [Vibrio aquimaris]QFT26607.1 putative HTH-type transcriptional regulator YvdT [Vibrio aquimaris]